MRNFEALYFLEGDEFLNRIAGCKSFLILSSNKLRTYCREVCESLGFGETLENKKCKYFFRP